MLLTGESGVGKEVFARYIHDQSERGKGGSGGPFVAINCAAIPDNLLEATLFGYEKGAFTGAQTAQAGKFEQANGGTLFLDEVADLDPELQLRLSSVIERRALIRCGGHEPVAIDARIVAATAQDLEALATAGRFREELYYQLKVVPLAVPPLRERSDDIPELLRYHADWFANRDKLPYRHFPVAVQNRLRHYAWPGNLRELRNLVQRLLVLGSGADVGLDEVELALGQSATAAAAPASAAQAPAIDFGLPLREAREQFERAYLLHQLDAAGGSVGKLAKAVGMERTHLYRKLKDLDIDPRAPVREGT